MVRLLPDGEDSQSLTAAHEVLQVGQVGPLDFTYGGRVQMTHEDTVH
jgi:hypothetical protein